MSVTLPQKEPPQLLETDIPVGWFRRYRSIITGLALTPVSIFYLLYMEQGKARGPYPSTLSLFANCILFLLILVALNRLVARLLPRLAFSQGELLVVYVMLVISTAICSFDFLDVLIPMMAYPFRHATPENNWAEIIWPYVPEWIAIRDPVALKGFYEGGTSAFIWSNLRPWLLPLGVWGAVAMVILFVMFCINTVVRQQWIQHDKLQFPIVELPMQLTEPNSPLLRSKLMWMGFGIAAGISILNGCHLLYPSLPQISVHMMDLSANVVSPPWNAMGWTPISFFPFAIGFGFMLPLDILFSSWFFFVMWRLVRIGGAALGIESNTGFPYMDQQALGAYYMVALFALWAGRRHIASVFKKAFTHHKDPEEARGPMSYQVAVLGMIAGTLALMTFFQLLGIRPWVAIAAVTLYFLIVIAIARVHAEFGPPSHELYSMGPEFVLVGSLGSKAFTRADLNGLTWFWWFNRAYDSQPIAYQLDSLKIADRGRIHQRYVALAIGLASIVAVVSGFLIYLYFAYKWGAGKSSGLAGTVGMYGNEAFRRHTTSWITNPTDPSISTTLAIGWGMLFGWFLYFMKLQFAWWPFHPLGFAVSTSWTMGTLWFPMFIAWLCKLITFRAGGLKTYRIALQFFLGLLMGDFVIGVLWPAVGWLLNTDVYCFTQ